MAKCDDNYDELRVQSMVAVIITALRMVVNTELQFTARHSTLLASTICGYLNPVDPMFLFVFIILCGYLCFVVVDFFCLCFRIILIESITVSVVFVSSV